MARVCPGKTKEDILENFKVPSTVLQPDMASYVGTRPLERTPNCASALTLLAKDEKMGECSLPQDKMTDTSASWGCSDCSKHPYTRSFQQERDFYMEMLYYKKAVS